MLKGMRMLAPLKKIELASCSTPDQNESWWDHTQLNQFYGAETSHTRPSKTINKGQIGGPGGEAISRVS